MILNVSNTDKSMHIKKNSAKFGIIYKIENKINSDFYIGSTNNLYKRYYTHINDIRTSSKTCVRLIRAAHKYGEDNLQFSILAKCPTEYTLKLEQWFLDNLKPKYNIAKIAGSNYGIKRSEEVKKAKSESQKNKWLDDDYRNHHLSKLSNNWKGGSKHHMAKVNEEKVAEIKDLFRKGFKPLEVSKFLGVSYYTVKDIKRNKTWKNVK
jgi:group I intron endonuclease